MELMSPLDSSTDTTLRMETLLRRLLLGKDANEVHFHVFSRRSNSRVLDPRVLNVDATLLGSSSRYFADLFSSDVIPSDTAVMNVKTPDMILDGIDQSEYGYESDSDLEDDTGTVVSPAQRQVTAGSDSNDGDSGTCALNTQSLGKDHEFLPQRVSNPIGLLPEGPPSIQPNAIGLGGGRHIFVKDAAFQTWYCLLHFLYTGARAEFSPLRSSGGSKNSSCNTSQRPKCSAKSMYRLATKLGIGKLRDLAFASIRSNIDENNLLQEVASRFTGRYPAVLEMELDLLLEKIASAPIIKGLPKLMERISEKELSHGAKIMSGFYTRILQKHYLIQLPAPATADAGAECLGDPLGISSTGIKKKKGKVSCRHCGRT